MKGGSRFRIAPSTVFIETKKRPTPGLEEPKPPQTEQGAAWYAARQKRQKGKLDRHLAALARARVKEEGAK